MGSTSPPSREPANMPIIAGTPTADTSSQSTRPLIKWPEKPDRPTRMVSARFVPAARAGFILSTCTSAGIRRTPSASPTAPPMTPMPKPRKLSRTTVLGFSSPRPAFGSSWPAAVRFRSSANARTIIAVDDQTNRSATIVSRTSRDTTSAYRPPINDPMTAGMPITTTTRKTILFCSIAGHEPATEPSTLTSRLVLAATRGSIPIAVITGSRTTPNAMPTIPPTTPTTSDMMIRPVSSKPDRSLPMNARVDAASIT